MNNELINIAIMGTGKGGEALLTMLPGIDGFEVCRRIRDALGGKARIVILTIMW
jgi:hypothetical protein